jgi:hypothetical protein
MGEPCQIKFFGLRLFVVDLRARPSYYRAHGAAGDDSRAAIY